MHKLLFKTAFIIHFLYHHCIKGTNCCCKTLQRKIILDSVWHSFLLTETASGRREGVYIPIVRKYSNGLKEQLKKKQQRENCTFLHSVWTTRYKTVLKRIRSEAII